MYTKEQPPIWRTGQFPSSLVCIICVLNASTMFPLTIKSNSENSSKIRRNQRRSSLTRRRLGKCDWWVHRHGDLESRWRKLPPASSIRVILMHGSKRRAGPRRFWGWIRRDLANGRNQKWGGRRRRRRTGEENTKVFDYFNGPVEYKWACSYSILFRYIFNHFLIDSLSLCETKERERERESRKNERSWLFYHR